MPNFNDNHKAKLLAAFQYLDELLGTSLDKLDRSEDFLFPPYLPNVTPVQRKLLGDYLVQLRQAMHRFLDAQGMTAGRPRTGTAWALRTVLSVAQTTLDELRPKNLRGYGELSAEGEQEIGAPLEQALPFYEHALQTWGMDYLAQLERAFSAAVSPVEAGLYTADKMRDAGTLARDIARLVKLRDIAIDQ